MNETALAVRPPAELSEDLANRKLALSAFDQGLIKITLDAVQSAHSERAYNRALVDFLEWYNASGRPPLMKAVLTAYAKSLADAGLSAGNVNQRLSAIRKMIREAEDNNLLRSVDGHDITSALRVKGMKQPGSSAGVWLNKEQVEMFLNHIDQSTLLGKRNFALITLFLTSGLRRMEMAGLKIGDIQQMGGRWAIPGLVGKRNKKRDVPIPGWTKLAIDVWIAAASLTEGAIFRGINKGGNLSGTDMSPEAIHEVIAKEIVRVNERLKTAGITLPRVKAHDLRRTFAQLALAGGSEVEQIQIVLGHESLETTQRYLGVKQNFTKSPCDLLGLNVK